MLWRQNDQQTHLRGHILVLVLIGVAEVSSSPDSHLRQTEFEALPLPHLLFTKHVVVEGPSPSRVECSSRCVETEGCAMWTFRPSLQGPPGLCRLHSELSTASDQRLQATGAESFRVTGPKASSPTPCPPTITPSAPASCDGGYQLKCGRCLQASGSIIGYIAAKQECNQLGRGLLVMPKTLDDLTCVMNFAMSEGVYSTWVGAVDPTGGGQFQWHDGCPLASSSDVWRGREPPAFSSNPQCVMTDVDKKLYSAGCNSSSARFLCQKPAM